MPIRRVRVVRGVGRGSVAGYFRVEDFFPRPLQALGPIATAALDLDCACPCIPPCFEDSQALIRVALFSFLLSLSFSQRFDILAHVDWALIAVRTFFCRHSGVKRRFWRWRGCRRVFCSHDVSRLVLYPQWRLGLLWRVLPVAPCILPNRGARRCYHCRGILFLLAHGRRRLGGIPERDRGTGCRYRCRWRGGIRSCRGRVAVWPQVERERASHACMRGGGARAKNAWSRPGQGLVRMKGLERVVLGLMFLLVSVNGQ